jgi:lipid A 3-O-deacylase
VQGELVDFVRLLAARRRPASLLFFFVFLLSALPLAAEPHSIGVSYGRYGIFRGEEAVEAGWELHFAPRRLFFLPKSWPEIIPVAGGLTTGQGTLYAYAGVRADVPLEGRWMVSPSWGTGLYYFGDGRDLGGALEFRSGLEISYRLAQGDRIGLCLYHLSNAALFRRNPGSESLALTYTAGLGRR